jgi:hypothetical protein
MMSVAGKRDMIPSRFLDRFKEVAVFQKILTIGSNKIYT